MKLKILFGPGAIVLGMLTVLAASAGRASALSGEGCENPDRFQLALQEHDKARIEFRYKMLTGYRRHAKRGDLAISRSRRAFLYADVETLIKAIAAHASAMDASGLTAVLIYEPDQGRCVWLIAPDGGVTAAELQSADHVSQLFRDKLAVTTRAVTRAPVKHGEDRGALASPDAPLSAVSGSEAEQLTERVLPETIQEQLLAAAYRKLLILPSRDLSSVPFAALRIGEPDHTLIDVLLPVVLPTVDALFFWVEAPKRFARGSSVVIGDPDLSGDPVWEFAVLPGARKEAEFAARSLGASPITGTEATFDTVREALGSQDLSMIYLATHGVSDAVNPMDGSFLALSGRHLTGGDIKALSYRSKHPVVVMSACQSGLGKTFESGVFGLARAWIHAGASQIVASLWNVDDEATSFLMKRFVTMLRAGKGTEAALHRAILDAKAKYDDPALWGGFSFFGYPQPR